MRRIILMVGVATFCLSSTFGCASIHYSGFEASLRPKVAPPFPPAVRNQVHVFIMNGLNVLESEHLNQLRAGIIDSGYAKVYIAQLADRAWYDSEIRRLSVDEPTARVVLISYGASAVTAHELVRCWIRDGLPIDSLILIDPVGLNGDLHHMLPIHVRILKSHNWLGSKNLVGGEEIHLQNVGHKSILCHPASIEMITTQLHAAASLIQVENTSLLPHLPLTDNPLPTPRPYIRKEPKSQVSE